jgi:poly(hydroxyalkanoate) depolymerase family esterase
MRAPPCVTHWPTESPEAINEGIELKIIEALRKRLQHRAPFDSKSRETSGSHRNIADTIETALAAAGLMRKGPARRPDPVHWGSGTAMRGSVLRRDEARPESEPLVGHDSDNGAFLTCAFTDRSGSLVYKLYVPSTYAQHSESVPLVVMLHGCTQSPDDFAAGTRMNQLAEEHGFLVAYPAQAQRANGSKCWNWFLARDQRRDEGEPSLIAGIAREVAAGYRIDQGRIFVAGLSAGAAMAVILGTTYPDLFAAVGAHSGLPYAAAHDVPSAFQIMRDPSAAAARRANPGNESRGPTNGAAPTIVFHGDRDSTVDSANGAAIVAQVLSAFANASNSPSSHSETSAQGGVRFTRTTHSVGAKPIIEDWVLHGGGHAWSGGSAAGSFTQSNGPDASREMIRFFLAQSSHTRVAQ